MISQENRDNLGHFLEQSKTSSIIRSITVSFYKVNLLLQENIKVTYGTYYILYAYTKLQLSMANKEIKRERKRKEEEKRTTD